MTETTNPRYDVLLLESHPHTGDAAAVDLSRAGHRVHRCFEGAAASVCAALDPEGQCPIDEGMDVAVLVRRPLEPLPTRREDGTVCARRAGVPIVEQGPEHPDPWGPWIDVRVDPGSSDLALITAGVARSADAPAQGAIRRAIAPLLQTIDVEPKDVACRLERSGTDLRVHLTLPTVADRRLRSAIAVRVLDGLRRSTTRTLGNVDVFVHPSEPAVDG